MNRGIALLLIIFLAFPSIVYSITPFIIQETEKISLQANATDPDADRLLMTYTAPLNENGEWQTTYGDAGEYKATITVSDGIISDSKEVLIIIKKKEEQPRIESFIPTEEVLNINEAESIDFRILASDLNKDELSYEWFLDDKRVKDGQEFSYDTTYDDAGEHKVSVTVSDGITAISNKWNVNVEDVGVEDVLDSIKDVIVDENEVVRLELPDFEKYKLVYSISEPIDNANEWKTSYEDAGSYEIKVHAEGKGFSDDKTVNVIVNDVDRAPVFDNIGNKALNEDEELKIILNADDLDGDEITYAADKMPEGAELDGNVFTWKPGYDTVKKEGFVNKLMDKFGILGKSFYVQFSVASKDKKIVQNIIITVKDANRAPVLEGMELITINEGDILKIVPKAYDLDGDKVSLSYSGFMNKDTFKSGFDDAGTYSVKVTASDGLLETSKFVEINIKQSNRVPLFGKVDGIKASENDNIAVLLNANDPDGDEISYSIDNPPEDSSIKGNAFLWNPSFDTASKKETKKFDLVFVASDGQLETRQIVKAEISDKNRAPRIINSTKSVAANVNKHVLMFVKAVDDDGDDMAYTWNFGFLEKYKATANHQRIFTSKGLKTVKVTVSDGIDKVEQVINVNVV